LTLAENIRARRLAQGYTLSALAHVAGLSKGYLSQLENADEQPEAARPSADTVQRLAEVFGTSVEDLLDKRQLGDACQTAPISATLAEFALQAHLSAVDTAMLARIRYQDAQPQTVDSWRFLYESIRRSVFIG